MAIGMKGWRLEGAATAKLLLKRKLAHRGGENTKWRRERPQKSFLLVSALIP
jgi:hypothetical protein